MAYVTCQCGHQTELAEFLAKGGLYCTHCGAKLVEPRLEPEPPARARAPVHARTRRSRFSFRRTTPAASAAYTVEGGVAVARSPVSSSIAAWRVKSATPYSGFAIAGLVCSFLCVPLGVIFSTIGLVQCRTKGLKGEWLAIVGLAISAVTIAASIGYALLVRDRLGG